MVHKRTITISLLAAAALFAAPATLHDAYSGHQAYLYTAQVAGFGERWPGPPGHKKTEDLIRQVLTKDHAKIETDDFSAATPKGAKPVHNIIGKFNVSADPKQKIFILAGHYDTLFIPGFIGANDGGSSTGILLAFADALAAHPTSKLQIWLVWTDLEEALSDGGFFDANDGGLYGSKHLAAKLKAAGLVPRIEGFFLLDMIGDKELDVARETNSERWLQDFISRAAADLGYSQYFFKYDSNIIDDQLSFKNVGIPVVDVVDAHFGRMGEKFDAMGEFHHAKTDTMDKVSEHSLEVVGKTILHTIELLDK